ncbi:MAG: hypothetical protein VR72_09940 [Clostridiaceae bacterium BRH_c20a]|nr:MAG: hypothetical protein VR72_09940 [Clostridiaceae bacterium BRH_c20a]
MTLKNNIYKPEGVFPAMMTPFDAHGNINEPVLRKLVNWLIEEGVNGLFPLGSVGEFIHLSFEQKVQIMKTVVNEARGRVPVLPSATESNAKKSIMLAKKAKELGCKGVVIAPTYYYPVSQEMMEEHFEQVAQAVSDLPIILYNIPLFGTPISYDVVKRLSRIENVVAMKDSSGSMVDLLHFMDKVRLIGENINILVGREEMLYSGLMVGAKGTMSATVGIVPEAMINIYKCWQQGDFRKANEIQFSILLLVRAMFALPFPLGFKIALELRGFVMGEPQQPLSDAEQYNYLKVKSRIEKIMKQLLGDKLIVI